MADTTKRRVPALAIPAGCTPAPLLARGSRECEVALWRWRESNGERQAERARQAGAAAPEVVETETAVAAGQ